MKRLLLITAAAICAALSSSGCAAENAGAVEQRSARIESHAAVRVLAFPVIPSTSTLPIATARIRELSENTCAPSEMAPARPEDAPALVNAFDDVVGGSATIAVYIDARGRPIAEDVRSYSDDGFRSAASHMLAGWPFVPARCDGRPVAGRYVVRFNA